MAAKMQDSLHPAGRTYLHLDCVETATVKSNFPTNPDGTADVFYWQFSSFLKDEGGVALRMRKMTDVKITPNNQTMKFWKFLAPGTTYETCSGDTADLEGKWYEAEIVHNTKGDKTYADIAFIKPYVKAKAATPPAEPGDDGGASGVPAPAVAPRPLATTRPQAPATVAAPSPAPDGPDEAEDPFADQ